MITRRHFLQNSTGAAAALLPAFMSAAGTARPGKRPAPSGRVTLALIGAGSQGTTDMRNFLQDERVQVVATCDVEKESDRYNKAFKGAFFGREPARRIVNNHYGDQASKSGGGNFCEAYEDFRDVLARKDIDAVLIATPDHWHVPISVLAARAGKHIYCE
jgi:predicted dehydrogenase